LIGDGTTTGADCAAALDIVCGRHAVKMMSDVMKQTAMTTIGVRPNRDVVIIIAIVAGAAASLVSEAIQGSTSWASVGLLEKGQKGALT